MAETLIDIEAVQIRLPTGAEKVIAAAETVGTDTAVAREIDDQQHQHGYFMKHHAYSQSIFRI